MTAFCHDDGDSAGRDSPGVATSASKPAVTAGSVVLFAAVAVLVAASVMLAPAIPDAYAALTFSAKFGETGTGNGELSDPAGVVLERSGRDIYVVDKGNNRISVFDNDGSFKETFGSRGSGDNQFNGPVSIVKVDREYYILDSVNKRVKIVEDDGTFVKEFGDRQLSSPTSIAVNQATQRVFVSDSGTDRIYVFDTNNHSYKYDISTFNGSYMVDPAGLAVDELNMHMYVADTGNSRIGIFQLVVERNDCPADTVEVATGVCYVGEFGGGTGNVTFASPRGMVVDNSKPPARGDLYVADTGNNRIQVFSFVPDNPDSCPSGTTSVVDGVCFVEKYGLRGSDDGKFMSPQGLAIDSAKGLLYVADTGNNRIQVLQIGASTATSTSSSSTSSSSSSSSSSTATTTVPNAPRSTKAVPISPDSILVTWREPVPVNTTPPLIISGYKVEYAAKPAGASSATPFEILTTKTSTNATSLYHTDLDPGTTYSYKVSAVAANDRTSSPGSTTTAKPADTKKPTIVGAVALDPKQVKIAWLPPSDTFRQTITEYAIYDELAPGTEVKIGTVGRGETTFLHTVDTNEIKLKVQAVFEVGKSDYSDTVSIREIKSSSHSGDIEPEVVGLVRTSEPTPPLNVRAAVVSDTQIRVSWSLPADTGNLEITGYDVEAKKKGSSDFTRIATNVNGLQYLHTGMTPGSEYTYRVYAENSKGESGASNEATAVTRTAGITIDSIRAITINEGETASFTASVSGDSAAGATFALNEAPRGAVISPATGSFSWTTSSEHGGETYLFEVVATQGAHSDKTTVRIKVNNVASQSGAQSGQTQQQQQQQPSSSQSAAEGPVLAGFVESGVDPQTYVDRYNNEPTFAQWFDDNYAEYDSIYHAVGLESPSAPAADDPATGEDDVPRDDPAQPPEPAEVAVPEPRELPRLDVPLAPFVDETADPMTYVDRYHTDETYAQWFDDNYAAEYGTIYRAVGLLDVPASFVEPGVDPQTYVDRYNNEPTFQQWFDENYSEYLSIYHAVGLPEPGSAGQGQQQQQDAEEPPPEKVYGICGPGTKLVDGVCTIIDTTTPE